MYYFARIISKGDEMGFVFLTVERMGYQICPECGQSLLDTLKDSRYHEVKDLSAFSTQLLFVNMELQDMIYSYYYIRSTRMTLKYSNNVIDMQKYFESNSRRTKMRTQLDNNISNSSHETEQNHPVNYRPLVNELESINSIGADPIECSRCKQMIEGDNIIYTLGHSMKTANEAWEAHEKLFGDPTFTTFCKHCIDDAADEVKVEALRIHSCKSPLEISRK